MSEIPMVLDVSVQTSRFHEAAATSINLHGLCISVGGDPGGDDDAGGDVTSKRDLLIDADLSLSTGTRYALIGRNGSGKSILLKVLASGACFDPEDRLNLRIQLVSQSFTTPPEDWTVQDEINEPPFGYDLTDALDAGKRAAKRSDLRSGLRGKEARGKALGAGDDSVPAHLADASLYMSIGPPLMSDVVSSFKTLGIPLDYLERPYGQLSGGWRMRVTLAKALLYQPHVLLLDEPTNHLDIGGINHLISVLQSDAFSDSTTIIFVSHDLHFINTCAQAVIQLQDQKLIVAKGNWDTLQKERGDRKKFTERHAEQQKKEQDRILSSIDASMRAAGKDDKLRKQLAGRKDKILDRGSGMMRNSKGHRFRRNSEENAGYHFTLLGEAETVREERPVHFRFEEPMLSRAHGSGGSAAAGSASAGSGAGAAAGGASLLSVDGLAFSYPGWSGWPGKPVLPAGSSSGAGATGTGKTGARPGPFTSVASGGGKGGKGGKGGPATTSVLDTGQFLELPDLNLRSGERLVLLGPNGHGKSTLLRLLVSDLRPARGEVRISSPQIGYFEQHSVARLGTEKRTALAYVLDSHRASGLTMVEDEEVQKMLGSFGLGPHWNTPVALLSGGQRVALEFVVIALRRPALLLLDEPNAHLDLQAREGLAQAIATFDQGAVLFISHDIGFIELCKPNRALLCKSGRFKAVEEERWKAVALSL